MNCVVSNTFNPHIGFEAPGMILSDGGSNAVSANYSYQNPYLGGGGIPPQGSAMYLQAAHYYSGCGPHSASCFPREAETPAPPLLSHGKVFVGWVPLGTSEAELRAQFSQFGTVAFVGAPKNKRFFVNPDDAAAAIAAGPNRNVQFNEVKEYFSKFNEVDREILVTDLNTKMPRWFASEESAARALKKDRHFLYGQWVEVSLAMPKQQNATSGTSKLPVQAHPFYPATSSNFTAAANYPSVVNIVHVVTPMNCVVSNTFNPHIGFEVPGMKLSDGVTNVVTANYSYQYPYLGGGEVPPQNSAMYLQATHYYSDS
uniref:RRM domain-containing protein n=1 Tax=Oryza glumipatula TaxID=40148 RepID=A0A0D9YFF4_9ORYZ